jgi:hypothetical protein
MRGAGLLPLLVACALPLTPRSVGAQAVGMRFPTVSGRNLEGRAMTLPDDFGGARTVVLVAFKQRQQRDVNTWLPALDSLRRADPTLEVYEIPTLSSGWTPLRWWIDGGMSRGIEDRAVREATVTVYIDKAPFKRALEIASEDSIHVLLLAADGRVTWRAAGPATADGLAALRRGLASRP